jgi:hypothetical protein
MDSFLLRISKKDALRYSTGNKFALGMSRARPKMAIWQGKLSDTFKAGTKASG